MAISKYFQHANKRKRAPTVASASPNQSKKHVRKSIPQPIREAVWRNHFGTSLDGICNICKRNHISSFRFHAGHIISVKCGGTDEVENLQPICDICNASMGVENLHEFTKRFEASNDFEFERLQWQTETDTLRQIIAAQATVIAELSQKLAAQHTT